MFLQPLAVFSSAPSFKHLFPFLLCCSLWQFHSQPGFLPMMACSRASVTCILVSNSCKNSGCCYHSLIYGQGDIHYMSIPQNQLLGLPQPNLKGWEQDKGWLSKRRRQLLSAVIGMLRRCPLLSLPKCMILDKFLPFLNLRFIGKNSYSKALGDN